MIDTIAGDRFSVVICSIIEIEKEKALSYIIILTPIYRDIEASGEYCLHLSGYPAYIVTKSSRTTVYLVKMK